MTTIRPTGFAALAISGKTPTKNVPGAPENLFTDFLDDPQLPQLQREKTFNFLELGMFGRFGAEEQKPDSLSPSVDRGGPVGTLVPDMTSGLPINLQQKRTTDEMPQSTWVAANIPPHANLVAGNPAPAKTNADLQPRQTFRLTGSHSNSLRNVPHEIPVVANPSPVEEALAKTNADLQPWQASRLADAHSGLPRNPAPHAKSDARQPPVGIAHASTTHAPTGNDAVVTQVPAEPVSAQTQNPVASAGQVPVPMQGQGLAVASVAPAMSVTGPQPIEAPQPPATADETVLPAIAQSPTPATEGGASPSTSAGRAPPPMDNEAAIRSKIPMPQNDTANTESLTIFGPDDALVVVARSAQGNDIGLHQLMKDTAAEFGMDVSNFQFNGAVSQRSLSTSLGGKNGGRAR